MTITRRSVARGAAWATPILVVGAAAPATAASPPQYTLSRFSLYRTTSSNCSNGYRLTIGGNTNGYGLTIQNSTKTSVTASAIYNVVWISANNVTFTSDSGFTGWSGLKATGSSRTTNGVTYYEYRSDYTGTVSVAANSSAYVPYAYTASTCVTGTTYITAGQSFATINGSNYSSPAGTTITTCSTPNGCS